jgi:excisionase family DNA binding protein
VQPQQKINYSRSRQAAKGGRRYASIEAAAEYLGVHKITIRGLMADGRLKTYRSSAKLVRVDLNELDALMERGA